MSRIKINLTEELKKIFKRDDMYTNNRYLNPEANKRYKMELRKKRKAERKVHFMLIETGSELPNCRRNRDCQNGYLHSSQCYNRKYEDALEPHIFSRRALLLDSNGSPPLTRRDLQIAKSTLAVKSLDRNDSNPQSDLQTDKLSTPAVKKGILPFTPTFSDEPISF